MGNVGIYNGELSHISVRTITDAELASIVRQATQEGVREYIQQMNAQKEINPEDLLPVSAIAGKYGLSLKTIHKRINERFVPHEQNPQNKKEKALRRKHLDEVLKK